MLISMFLACQDKKKYNISWDDITSFLVYAIVIGIICARIYYVIFKSVDISVVLVANFDD